jgi:hypothetical protein
MTSEDASIVGSINPFGHIDIARVKLLLGNEGFDEKSIVAILSACKSLGIDVFSSRAIDQIAGISAVLLLCDYDVDLSGMFGKKHAQAYSQAISVAFKKIRDAAKVQFAPKKGPDVRQENARNLAAKLHDKREDLAFMKGIESDTRDKMTPVERQPEKAAVKIPGPMKKRSPGERMPEQAPVSDGVRITIPAEIVIGPQAIVDLQKSIVDKFASIMEKMRDDVIAEVSGLVKDRAKAAIPPEKPAEKVTVPVPEPALLPEPARSPQDKPVKTRHLHLVIIDLYHLHIFAKKSHMYFNNTWTENMMRKIYANVVATAKKLGIPFDINNVVGYVFITTKYAYLERLIVDFGLGSKDMAMRAFPGKLAPWHVVPGTKYRDGHEIELDVDTWVVNAIDKEALAIHPGEILTLHLVCGDKDMLPAVDTAKEAGIHVIVMSYKRAIAEDMVERSDDVQYVD